MSEGSLPPLPPAVEKLIKLGRLGLVGCGLEELVCLILDAYPHLTDEEVEEFILATRVPGTPPRPITLKSGVTIAFFPGQRSTQEAPDDEPDEDGQDDEPSEEAEDTWDGPPGSLVRDEDELVALIRKNHPTLTDEEIEDILQTT